MAKEDLDLGVSPDVAELLRAKRNNPGGKTAGGRTIPLSGNAELYQKDDGTITLRKKTSVMPSLPQQSAIRECANTLEEVHDEEAETEEEKKGYKHLWGEDAIYNFMNYCMQEKGFEGEKEVNKEAIPEPLQKAV